jgi:hypothetical protein
MAAAFNIRNIILRVQVVCHSKVLYSQCVMIAFDILQFRTAAVAGVMRMNMQILSYFHFLTVK